MGGADIPFSNNGPLDGTFHIPGTTTTMVTEAGTYKIDYNVSTTAGIGSQVAIAVNGVVNPSTAISALTSTGEVSGTALLTLNAGDVITLRNNSGVTLAMPLAPSVGAQMNLVKVNQDMGNVYQLSTVADATVIGGADIPFSNNGPLDGTFHIPGTTTTRVPETGVYRIDYNVSTTAGIGSQVAVAVNGTVDSSTCIPVLNSTGEVSGTALLSLTAGDVITLRNNSLVPLTTALAPAVGAQMNLVKVNQNQDIGNGYQLPTIVDSTVIGGADIPFSNNGPLNNVTHSAGTTTYTVGKTGEYKINYNVNIIAGIGSQLAIAVNGMVDPSTTIPVLTNTGEVSGTALLSLAAGDVITLRNNSLVPLTTALAPAVGAQMNVVLEKESINN